MMLKDLKKIFPFFLIKDIQSLELQIPTAF